MFKWFFGLNSKDKTTLKIAGLTDLELETIEKAGYYIIKRNFIILSGIAFIAGIIFGQIY